MFHVFTGQKRSACTIPNYVVTKKSDIIDQIRRIAVTNDSNKIELLYLSLEIVWTSRITGKNANNVVKILDTIINDELNWRCGKKHLRV